MNKEKLLISVIALSLAMTGCGIKDIASVGANSNLNTVENKNTQTLEETNTNNEITLFADYADYEETIQIERNDYNRDDKYRDNDLISSYAWGIESEQYNDKTALILYQRIGGRNYYKDNLKIVLVWQDGEFKPVKMETVDKTYEW